MENVSQMSLLEIAIYLMEQKKAPQSIKTLIAEVLQIKGIDDADGKIATQLYIDITTSSKFVYMGNEEWDLKSRQSLDQYDKDGSAFNVKGADLEDVLEEDEFEDEENLDDEEDDEDEDREDEDEFEDEEEHDDEYEEDDEDDESEYDEYDEDDDAIIDGEITERYSEDDFNEDKYNDLMDDYEDMYEDD